MVVVTVAGLRRLVGRMADMPGDSLINMRVLGLRGSVVVEHPDDSTPDMDVRFQLEDMPER